MYKSAKVPLLETTPSHGRRLVHTQVVANTAFRQKRSDGAAQNAPRFDCVEVSVLAGEPVPHARSQIFQVLSFFALPAKALREFRPLTADLQPGQDLLFALCGGFRRVQHSLWDTNLTAGDVCGTRNSFLKCTLGNLKHGLLVKLVCNATVVDGPTYDMQRFQVLPLESFVRLVHLVPLFAADKTPVLADRLDLCSNDDGIPAGVIPAHVHDDVLQLHYLNGDVHL